MSQQPAAESPDVATSIGAADAPAIPVSGKACANCGAPMFGPFCYACGQPEKGMIRHLASVMADVADTVFNIDSRVFRSIGPLYFRPGYLTCEYFAGRRTRYVTPFRLFFFLCIVSFFAIQSSFNIDHMQLGNAHSRLSDNIDNAQTPAQVQERTQAALAGLEKAKKKPALPSIASTSIDKAADALRADSAKRLAYLKARDEALAKGEKPPPDPADESGLLVFDDIPWDPAAHPLQIAWLPHFANARLTEMAVRAKDNIVAAKRDPRHAIAGMFSVLPQTLFVMMPLFAVLLKFTYLFKRRLYMEHLMVALHSHAFIFLSLLLVALISLCSDWLTDSPALVRALALLNAAVWTWLPIYLLLMQKRVYRQGWFMTSLKYAFVGFCYVVMLGFGMAAAVIVSLATA